MQSLIVLVPNKDGLWRMYIDYRDLNNIIIKNYYPLPWIDDLMDHLQEEKCFTKLESRSGYYQVRIKEEDI